MVAQAGKQPKIKFGPVITTVYSGQNLAVGVATRFKPGSKTKMSVLFALDTFCLRQFLPKWGGDAKYTGTRVDFDPKAFEAEINRSFAAGEVQLVDGYAPFCKHLFVPNFANGFVSTHPHFSFSFRSAEQHSENHSRERAPAQIGL